MIFLENLDQKKLKIIAGVIATLLVLVVIFIGMTAEKPHEEGEEVISEIYNDNEKIVHHSGDIYCYTSVFRNNRWANVLLKLPVDFASNSSRMIIQEFSSVGENIKLNFENNRVFFKSGSNTYMYNIIQNRIDTFCEGELQFLYEPNSFVTLYNGNLYKGNYYPATYLTKTIKKLAEGNFKKLDEDENRVYYSTSTGTSNTIVVALDKTTLNIILIDNFETKKQTIEDLLVTDNYVYELISDDSGKFIRKVSKEVKEENSNIEFEILPIEKAEYIEFIESEYSRPLSSSSTTMARDDLYFYIGDLEDNPDTYMTDYIIVNKEVFKYDESKNEVDLYTGVFNELWLDNYILKSIDSNVDLYYKDKYITTIQTNVTGKVDLKMNSVNIIGDYLYYEFIISNETDSDIVFARTLRQGGDSQRINLPE